MSTVPMQISRAGGQTVATDLIAMFSSVDSALSDTARLATSIMETSKLSAIPPARLQPALESAAASFAKLVDGRKDMVAMHRSLAVLKKNSDIDVFDFGCGRLIYEGIFGSKPEVITA